MAIEFPGPSDDDSEDVAWQLTTGAALWKRGERYDAILWLKRAIAESSRTGAAARADHLNSLTTQLMAALAAPARSESTPAPAGVRPPIPARSGKPPVPALINRTVPSETKPDGPPEPRQASDRMPAGDRVPARSVPPARNELPSVTTSAPPLETLTQRRAGSPPLRPASRPPPPTIVPNVAVARIPAITPLPSATRTDQASAETDTGSAGPVRLLARVLGALVGLTPEQRAGLTSAARIDTLAAGEEISINGLAMVVDGEATVGAAISDVAAVRVAASEPLLAHGSISDALALRVVAEAEPTTIASWERNTAEHWLALTPELLDQWRHASDRLQAMSGSTIGPVGERLDEGLRAMLFDRLEVRALEPGTVVSQAGSAVPGIAIVGVGHLELERDGAVFDKLGPGEFLFGAELLAQTPAPATARAGARGALLLTGSRSTTYELLMSCPPLLEIFAGM